jgi:hypothetical protein
MADCGSGPCALKIRKAKKQKYKKIIYFCSCVHVEQHPV